MTGEARPFQLDVGGVGIAGETFGDPTRPTIVLVHGFPDDRGLWDLVAPALAERFHVVSYDVRGHGDSDDPGRARDYGFDRLMDDLRAVADHASPDRPVHLVGHDWGAIQGWEAVTRPDVADRIATFTAMSAPSFDHAGAWIRQRLRAPSVGGTVDLVRQGIKSWYIGGFQLPFVPEAIVRSRVFERLSEVLPAFDGLRWPDEEHPERFGRNAANGVNLYRANLDRVLTPKRGAVRVPVQVVCGEHDAFVSPELFADLDHHAADVMHRIVPGGRHWLPRTHPDLVTDAIAAFVAAHEGEEVPMSSSTLPGDGRPWSGRLVVVTGGGQGIGRATAVRAAERGAVVVIADIDLDLAERAVVLAGHVGPGAHPYQLDVSDADAFERFAKDVMATHGVPDVVVNNAGIGMAGPFLDTDLADWDRILGVNLRGVVHGCRAFGRAMVERGSGHIVNLSSGVAFAPVSGMSAYSATKAAVLMLSEILRAELAPHGVGVSAICPGVIDTGITRRTAFVGVDEEEAERRRRTTTRLYQRRSLGPDAVAAAIIRAVNQNEAVVPVGIEARIGQLAGRYAPAVVRRLGRIDLVGR